MSAALMGEASFSSTDLTTPSARSRTKRRRSASSGCATNANPRREPVSAGYWQLIVTVALPPFEVKCTLKVLPGAGPCPPRVTLFEAPAATEPLGGLNVTPAALAVADQERVPPPLLCIVSAFGHWPL